ncbi:MAG: amidohydrolase family protein [Acidobacteria bacterium]|nr:amidohydrolase family protein [Acidobacteriota bacterium]
MFRVDAQHSYAPPHQGPDWYGKILARNKFSASVYVPHEGAIADALALAERYPYIRRVVPRIDPGGLAAVPEHPLIVSVHLSKPDAAEFRELDRRGLAAELDAVHWPFNASLPLALHGIPDAGALPENVYIKLTGFRLPVSAELASRLRELLRYPGPERLMYASGWPHGGGTWKETLAAFTQSLGAMPIALREQLLGGTARAFYRI